ncbi:DUF4743 domain-containing protein [Pelistega europaea]|uniref:DUF4743 domain-containing protein n=1 Tax=Pelistega europaea TaxID=106147 RepID=A0A7Y4LAR0_9BURK|nr:DUF4743 domain-containing protein [Pelistega europaea]
MQTLIQRLKQQLFNEIQQPPIADALPLYINSVLVGSLHPKAVSVTQNYPFFSFSAQAAYIDVPLDVFADRSVFFNQLAQYLREQGALPFWRNEQVNLWRDGQVFAHIERTATRSLGLLTQAIHLNAWTPEGKIYLSLRAPTKQTDPNKWDTIAGGLLNAEDSQETGLERETLEEAGVAAEHLQQRSPIRSIDFVRRPLPEGYQYEEVLASDCILPFDVCPQNMDGEVSEIATFTVTEVLDLMQQDMVTKEAMVVLLDSLEQHIFQQLVNK